MEQVKIEPSPDVAHRGWLANLKQGDRVEVPYSPAKGDIKLMTGLRVTTYGFDCCQTDSAKW
jgi:hypothetical protein